MKSSEAPKMQGIIPAAGYGMRLSTLPFTRLLPKPMLPVVDKPIVHHVLDTMVSLGIHEVLIVVSSLEAPIVKYFEDGSEFGVDIDYVVQDRPTGIADAILLCEPLINGNFIVILGDSLIPSDSISLSHISSMLTYAVVVEGAIHEPDIEAIKRTCCVEMDEEFNITSIVEKPLIPTSNYRGCGFYAFRHEVFDAIRLTPRTLPRNVREITTTIDLLVRSGKAKAFVFDKAEININTIEDLLRATRVVLERMERLRLAK